MHYRDEYTKKLVVCRERRSIRTQLAGLTDWLSAMHAAKYLPPPPSQCKQIVFSSSVCGAATVRIHQVATSSIGGQKWKCWGIFNLKTTFRHVDMTNWTKLYIFQRWARYPRTPMLFPASLVENRIETRVSEATATVVHTYGLLDYNPSLERELQY